MIIHLKDFYRKTQFACLLVFLSLFIGGYEVMALNEEKLTGDQEIEQEFSEEVQEQLEL